jgi:hypothetical protein
MSKHPKPHGGQGNNDPEGSRHHRTDISGVVGVRGEVETRLPADIQKQYDTAEEEKNRRDKRRFVVEVITFITVAIYAFITALQWYATKETADAAKQANNLLEESTRARLGIYSRLGPIQVGSIVRADVTATNLGHALAVVGTHYGYDRRTELPDGDMPLNAGSLDSLLEPGKDELTTVIDPHFMTQDLLDNVPKLRDLVMDPHPHSPTIYLYGRLDYETLGNMHKVEFCYFLVRNDPTMVSPTDSPIKGDEFVLKTCPKWNSST